MSVSPAKGGPRKPPRFLFTYVLNPLMRLLLRSPLHARLSGALLLLTFTGRKSGRTHTTPVGYHREDDTLVSFTHDPWWRNFEGGAPVRVVLQGRERSGWAEATRDPEQVWPRVEAFAREHGVREAMRRIGSFPPSRGEVGTEDLRAATRGLALIRIRLRDEPSLQES